MAGCDGGASVALGSTGMYPRGGSDDKGEQQCFVAEEHGGDALLLRRGGAGRADCREQEKHNKM